MSTGPVDFRPNPAMEVTEIRVKLTPADPRNKLRAYCCVTFDNAFVVRDLKVIEGVRGPFIAMPSRKLADSCGRCSVKNHLRAAYCNGCGSKLDPNRAPVDPRGRARLHADLAHPINNDTRAVMHGEIVSAYLLEIERSQEDGYAPPVFDDLDDLAGWVDDSYLRQWTGGPKNETVVAKLSERASVAESE